jgi:Tfp pilus assembly protein FimV
MEPVAPLQSSDGALDDKTLAMNMLAQAKRMEAEAKGMIAEAARMKKEAQGLHPSVKLDPFVATTQAQPTTEAPKRGRPKKVAVPANAVQ